MEMFASEVKDVPDTTRLQQHLDALGPWIQKCILQLNTDTYTFKTIGVGHYLMTRYYLVDNGVQMELKETDQERNTGVWVTSVLKPSEQCS